VRTHNVKVIEFVKKTSKKWRMKSTIHRIFMGYFNHEYKTNDLFSLAEP
jgi:hypothetical protein